MLFQRSKRSCTPNIWLYSLALIFVYFTLEFFQIYFLCCIIDFSTTSIQPTWPDIIFQMCMRFACLANGDSKRVYAKCCFIGSLQFYCMQWGESTAPSAYAVAPWPPSGAPTYRARSGITDKANYHCPDVQVNIHCYSLNKWPQSHQQRARKNMKSRGSYGCMLVKLKGLIYSPGSSI